MSWVDWVGIDYNRKGWKKEDGLFCWSLIVLAAKELFDKEVPRIEYDARKLVEKKGLGAFSFINNYEQVHIEDARAGDYLHMQTVTGSKLTPTHIGIFVSDEHILHIDNDRDKSMIQSIHDDNFKWRIIQP